MAGAPTISALFSQRVVIGVGDMAVSNNDTVTLSTYALGSCVGIVAYDPNSHAGGILHIMLPDGSISPDKAANIISELTVPLVPEHAREASAQLISPACIPRFRDQTSSA